jgi:hypothetical protein
MSYYILGDEEHDDRRFLDAGPGALELYVRALGWCMHEVRYRPEAEIPAVWFIPIEWVRGQHQGVRLANRLVDQGVFGRVDGGYRFDWIRWRNTPDAVRRQRKRERDKKAKRDANSPGGNQADSPGGAIRGNRR